MKRILIVLLACLLLLPLISCSKPIPKKTETDEEFTLSTAGSETENGEASKQYPPVCDRLSWEALNAFPVVHETMTTEEMRSLCVDFFRYCQSFAWTPQEDYQYTVENRDEDTTLKAGTVYGGLPYVTAGMGNIYRLMDYYDENTGVVDIKRAGANPKQFGNQCSFGSFWAWARVVNSANLGSTSSMVKANGYLPVGPYRYDPSISAFRNGDTKKICEENGAQTMFRSYALLEKADGVVNYNTAGHVMMCSAKAHVEYTDTGEIDGEKSYITYIHQASGWSDGVQSDGSTYRVQTVPDSKKSFQKLFREYYLPFTFAEFQGIDPTENPETSFSCQKESVTLKELSQASVSSNYAIADLYLNLLDETGKVVYSKSIRPSSIDLKSLSLGPSISTPTAKKLADGKNRVDVVCQLATGQRLTVYSGMLMPN